MAEVTPSQPHSAPSPSRGFLLLQRSSSQTRIEEILDNARTRNLQFAKARLDEQNQMSRPLREQSGPNPDQDGGAGESSADEATAIMRRESARTIDYQAIVPSKASKAGSSVRKRNNNEESGAAQPATDDDTAQDESWWKRQIEKYGAVELENKGSTARDHLALERTFLAWLRTSLAFASIGIAITQLFRLNTTLNGGSNTDDPYLHLRQMGKPLGATFLGISILVLGIGFHRYFESQHWIIRGKFPASRGSVLIIAVVTFAVMVTSLVVVVVVEPSAFEKRNSISYST